MAKFRNIVSTVLIMSLLIALFVSCGASTNHSDSQDESQQDDLSSSESFNINVVAPGGAPLLTMIKMFEEQPSLSENINITYEQVASPDLLSSKVMNGEADIAIVPTNLASVLYNKGAEYTLCASTVWGVQYLIGTEEINSIEDLKGKEIYTFAKGMTPTIVLNYILSENNIDVENDLTLNYFNSAQEIASAYIAGECDIAVVSEPMLTNIMTKKPETKILLDFQEEWAKLNDGQSYPQASLIISNELINDNKDFVDAFLAEYKNSIDWLYTDTETAGEYSEILETGMTKDTVVNGIDRTNIKYVSAVDSKDSINQYLTIISEFNESAIGNNLPNDDFFYEN